MPDLLSQRIRKPSVSSPLYESHPAHTFMNGRPNRQYSTSELTESSITSSNDPDDTQRLDYRHQPNPSMSSISSDQNLFGFEEDSRNTSSVSIPASLVSEQSTPVFGKRLARFEGYKEEVGPPSPTFLA